MGYLLNRVNKASPGPSKNKMESVVTQLRSLLGAATDGSCWEDPECRGKCKSLEGIARKHATALPWGVQEQVMWPKHSNITTRFRNYCGSAGPRVSTNLNSLLLLWLLVNTNSLLLLRKYGMGNRWGLDYRIFLIEFYERRSYFTDSSRPLKIP